LFGEKKKGEEELASEIIFMYELKDPYFPRARARESVWSELL
jgi:hypothetical protein